MVVHHPPAFCPVHGMFPATGFAMAAGAMQYYFSGQQDCPLCGHPSEIIPGVYDALPNGLNILVDPSISKEALVAIRTLAERLQRNEISPENAKAEAEKISPKAGKLFDIANWSDQAKATLYASIIAAVAVVAAARMATSSNPTIIIQPVVDRVIERQITDLQSTTSIPHLPTPAPRSKGPH